MGTLTCSASTRSAAIDGRRPSSRRDPLRRSVVVLGHRFWTQQAGADPEAIGRGLLINREAFTINGVMPPSFLGETPGSAVDVWVPIERLPALVPGRADWLQARNHGWLSVMARLAPGVSAGRAQSAMTTLLPRVMQQGDRMEPGEQGSVDAYRTEVRSGPHAGLALTCVAPPVMQRYEWPHAGDSDTAERASSRSTGQPSASRNSRVSRPSVRPQRAQRHRRRRGFTREIQSLKCGIEIGVCECASSVRSRSGKC